MANEAEGGAAAGVDTRDDIDVIADAVNEAREEGVFGDGGDGGEETPEALEGGDDAPETPDTSETPETSEVKVETTPKKEEPPPAPEAKEPPAKVKTLDEQLDDEIRAAGIKRKGREDEDNPVPHSRIKPIAMNHIKRMLEPVLGEVATDLGVDAKMLSLETLPAVIKQTAAQIAELRDETASMQAIAPIMENDPDRYIRGLDKLHPGKYTKFVELLDGKAAPATAAEPEGIAIPEPDLDITLADGTKAKTLSMEKGIPKLIEAITAAVTKQVRAEYDPKLKPVTDKAEAEAAEREHITGVASYVKQTLADAKDLPDWETHKDAVKTRIGEIDAAIDAKNAELSAAGKPLMKKPPFHKVLHLAYTDVVTKAVRDAATTAHESALAEARRQATKKPGGAPSTAPGKAPVRPAGNDEVDDDVETIRNAVADAVADGRIR